MVSGAPGTPRVDGIIETAIYVEDVARSAAWYERVLGARIMGQDERGAFLDVAGRSVLLIFQKTLSRAGADLPGGHIPGHDGSGRLHIAFAIGRDQVDPWRRRLAELGVDIESEVSWPRGGRSLYVRDPDGLCVELATPGIWEIY